MSKRISLSAERLRQFRDHVLLEYYGNSVVRNNFVARLALSDETGNFVRIGRRFLSDGKPFVDEYSRGEEYFSPEILGLGRSIAIGEEAYFIKQLHQFFPPSECPSKTDMIAKLAALAAPLSIAFIPLEYLNDFYSLQTPGMRLEFEPAGVTYLIVGPNKMRIYWSHKEVKFTRFLFLARDAVEWVVKSDPQTRDWLRVDVRPARVRQFEVNVETIALCKLANENHALAITLEEKPIDTTHPAKAINVPALEDKIIRGYYFEFKELAPGILRVAAFETSSKPSPMSNPVDPSRIDILLRLFGNMGHLKDYKVEYEPPSLLKAQGTEVLVRGIRANVSKRGLSPVPVNEIQKLIDENLANLVNDSRGLPP